MKTYHTQKDGKKILISDMTIDHLINTISLLYRTAKRGIVRRTKSNLVNDWSSKTEYLNERQAIKYLNIGDYTQELNRRMKT